MRQWLNGHGGRARVGGDEFAILVCHDADDSGVLLSRADLAMYAAKAAGKACYAVADITGSCAVPADAV